VVVIIVIARPVTRLSQDEQGTSRGPGEGAISPSMSCSQRVPLEIVDLPGIKIKEAKPRRLSLMTQRVHSMRDGGTRMHPSATRFSGGADVTAFGGPGLVIFLTVVA
jgi:hypothetical protein